MLSKKDQAIKYAMSRPKIINTFWSNTTINQDGCIVWNLGRNPAGYSRLCVRLPDDQYIDIFGHRFAYALTYGFNELPRGIAGGDGNQFVLNHICFNKACVNPKHLEVITQKHNSSVEKRKPRKPNDCIVADNLEDFMAQIANTDRE